MYLNMFPAVFLATIFSRGFGQEGHVNLLSVETCWSKPNFDLSITMMEDHQWIVSLTAEAEEVIDLNDLQYKAKVLVKIRDSYKELIALEGNFCGFIKDVLGAEWDRIRSAVVPELGQFCEIEPGTYELNGFEINLDNSNLGSLMPRRQMKAAIEVNRGQDTLACAVFEFVKS